MLHVRHHGVGEQVLERVQAGGQLSPVAGPAQGWRAEHEGAHHGVEYHGPEDEHGAPQAVPGGSVAPIVRIRAMRRIPFVHTYAEMNSCFSRDSSLIVQGVQNSDGGC